MTPKKVKAVLRSLHLPNATEQAYIDYVLKPGRASGRIQEWYYEPITFRLANRTTYTPDFLVINVQSEIEMIEIKGGFIREDALVKFKVAREMFPCFHWKFVRASKRRGKWEFYTHP
jgi:hypothetical protein